LPSHLWRSTLSSGKIPHSVVVASVNAKTWFKTLLNSEIHVTPTSAVQPLNFALSILQARNRTLERRSVILSPEGKKLNGLY
jgi:hypothetical protein